MSGLRDKKAAVVLACVRMAEMDPSWLFSRRSRHSSRARRGPERGMQHAAAEAMGRWNPGGWWLGRPIIYDVRVILRGTLIYSRCAVFTVVVFYQGTVGDKYSRSGLEPDPLSSS